MWNPCIQSFHQISLQDLSELLFEYKVINMSSFAMLSTSSACSVPESYTIAKDCTVDLTFPVPKYPPLMIILMVLYPLYIILATNVLNVLNSDRMFPPNTIMKIYNYNTHNNNPRNTLYLL